MTFRTDEMSRNWQCDVAAGVEISLSVRDSNGQMIYSAPSTVRMSSPLLLFMTLADEEENSTDLTCLPGYVPPDS